MGWAPLGTSRCASRARQAGQEIRVARTCQRRAAQLSSRCNSLFTRETTMEKLLSASPTVSPDRTDVEECMPVQRLDPFLRWAGGKRWLVPQIEELLRGASVRQYHEPFLGGGSVFFSLPYSSATLSDLNGDLIDVYREVRDNPEDVATALKKFTNTSEDYYRARASVPTDPTERAARFVFLNHTSYNGIFRVNLKGEYNVPFGRRKHANIPDADRLVAISRRLSGVVLSSGDFGEAIERVESGDLVFLDPPYTVAHNNNGFVKYNQHLFSYDDQKRLARSISGVLDRGASFILTNAAHSSIEELFGPLGRKISVSRRNSVGGSMAARGRTEEYLFTNVGVN